MKTARVTHQDLGWTAAGVADAQLAQNVGGGAARIQGMDTAIDREPIVGIGDGAATDGACLFEKGDSSARAGEVSGSGRPARPPPTTT